jgi:hypothetical protein
MIYEIIALTSALDSFQRIDSTVSVRLTKLAPAINLADSETQNLYSNHCFIAQNYGTVFYG